MEISNMIGAWMEEHHSNMIIIIVFVLCPILCAVIANALANLSVGK